MTAVVGTGQQSYGTWDAGCHQRIVQCKSTMVGTIDLDSINYADSMQLNLEHTCVSLHYLFLTGYLYK